MPLQVTVPAGDGFPLRAQVWSQRLQGGTERAPVVIINPATSVHSRYYRRFASFLCAHGFNVITYDYRGIGGSRPSSMRGFQASWLDWGSQDFEAILHYAHTRFADSPIQVVAHSVGGLLVGMAASNFLIQRVFTVGAQFAYWPDYAKHKRFAMVLRWHMVMPILTAIFGYFPGKRLGWLEDTPKGVVRDWVAMDSRLESKLNTGSRKFSDGERLELLRSFERLTGPTLALSFSDDEFGTISAINRLLSYYKNSASTHLRFEPRSIGQNEIGHFAFFNDRYAESLWLISLDWLRDGTVSEMIPAQLIPMALDQ